MAREPGAACLWVFGPPTAPWRRADRVAGHEAPEDPPCRRPGRRCTYRLVARAIDHFIEGLRTASVAPARGHRRGRSRLARGPGPVNARAVQRAETIGAVLRSIAKVYIGTVAVLTVLGEFGVNLRPPSSPAPGSPGWPSGSGRRAS